MAYDNSTIRGRVLVICNSFCDTKADRKKASKEDEESMKKLWGIELGCDSFSDGSVLSGPDFKVHIDVSAEDMLKLLSSFAQYKSQIDYSYIAVVVSTHGGLVAESLLTKEDPSTGKDDSSSPCADSKAHDIGNAAVNKCVNEEEVEVLLGNDFRPIKLGKIKELFYNNAAPLLQDIPKFFILNYCRDKSAYSDVIPFPQSTTPCDKISSTPLHVSQMSKEMKNLLPTVSDVLTIYATLSRDAAMENYPVFGSWLITTIAKVFKAHAKQMHVVDMLTIVNEKIKEKEGKNGSGQIERARSIYESSLERHLYLCDEAKIRGENFIKEIETSVELEQSKAWQNDSDEKDNDKIST